MTVEPKKAAVPVLKRLFAPFIGDGSEASKSGEAALRSAFDSVTKISEVMQEHSRLEKLNADETDKLETLSAKRRALDAQRIEALTDYRVSGDEAANDRAKALLKQCADLGQEIDDVGAVSNGISERIRALDEQIKSLGLQYRTDLGAFLTGIHTRLIERYNELAPDVAEVVLQLAATRRVMLRYLAGNSNGWNGQILLPGMKAGEGKYIEAVLDGNSNSFDREANERMDGIVEEMRAAGFIWRLS